MDASPEKPLALVGLMGAGKSAVARALGARTGLPVVDLDAAIEREEGRTISVLFRDEGEDWFRAREGRALADARTGGARIIACGGGIVSNPAQRQRLAADWFTVWLDVTPAQAAARLAEETDTRPLLAAGDPLARLEALQAERRDWFDEVSAARVPVDGHSIDEIAEAVLRAWGRA